MATDVAKLREARIALTAEMLHGFVARFADTEPFFDNLKPEARARYFKEAVRFLEELDDALLESPDVILIRRNAEGNWPKEAIRQAVAIVKEIKGTSDDPDLSYDNYRPTPSTHRVPPRGLGPDTEDEIAERMLRGWT